MEAKTNSGNGTSPADHHVPAKLLPDAPPVGQIPPAQAPAETPAERAGNAEASTLERIGNGAVRGVVAAMAMTGFREFTRRVGLLQEPPPEAIVRQRLLGRFRRAKTGRRRAGAEVLHWTYGAAGGAEWRGVRAARKQFEGLIGAALDACGVDDPGLRKLALLGMVNHLPQWYRPRGRLSPQQIADGWVELALA